MGLSQMKFCLILVVFLSFSNYLCASTFISDGIFGSSVLSERRLLQAKKPCPENFEFKNYTIITSKCKGPQYLPSLCCPAFKELACPYSDVLNDLSNDCASTMFSYINLYGKYPPGLFASECREGQKGLDCTALPPGSSQADSASASANSGSMRMSGLLSLMMLAIATLSSNLCEASAAFL